MNRLTIETKRSSAHVEELWYANIRLDGFLLLHLSFDAPTEARARERAEAWFAELLEHFRSGGS